MPKHARSNCLEAGSLTPPPARRRALSSPPRTQGCSLPITNATLGSLSSFDAESASSSASSTLSSPMSGSRSGSPARKNFDEKLKLAAYGLPTTIEAAHFLVTCEIQAVSMWVYWREEEEGTPKHYMKHLFGVTLRQEQMLSRAREILWNIVDHALGARLQSIKQALPQFTARCTFPAKSRRSTTTTSASGSSSSAPIAVLFPPTLALAADAIVEEQMVEKRPQKRASLDTDT
jgi:hypothetical protein